MCHLIDHRRREIDKSIDKRIIRHAVRTHKKIQNKNKNSKQREPSKRSRGPINADVMRYY